MAIKNGTPGDDTLVGGSRNNTINGLVGDDTLNGRAGKDTLNGGTGNDTLNGGAGKDILNGDAGNDTLNGGTGQDTLNGDTGNDTLDGGQGQILYDVFGTVVGIDATTDGDIMAGGKGDDIYVVTATDSWLWATDGFNSAYAHSPGSKFNPDIVIEQAGEGRDTVLSYVSYKLPDNVEDLSLFSISQGRDVSESINGTGNNLNNIIIGNSKANSLIGNGGNDHLDGREGADKLFGGSGNDTLRGGAGKNSLTGGTGDDTFVFDNIPKANNVDTLKDFASGQDKLQLDDAKFAQIGATGQFSAADERFWASADGTAHDATDRIVYNTDSGALFYDADGNGGGTAVQIAILTDHPALNAADIWVA